MRFRVPVPSTAPSGEGLISAYLYPRSNERETPAYFGGGTHFEVASREEVVEFPEGAYPDLVVSASDIGFDPSSPRSGETIFIDVDITNQGSGPARSVEALAYNGSPDEGGVTLEDRAGWTQPTLPLVLPGETRRLRLRWDPFLNAGDQTIFVNVDPHDRIAESDEDNNSASASLHVRKKIDLALVQEDFEIAATEELPGYQMRAAVRNIGETPSDPFLIQIFIYESDDPEEAPLEYIVEQDKTPRIPPKRRANFPVQLPASALRFEMVVDPDDILDEETHKNNRINLRVEELLSASAELPSATSSF